MRRFLHILFATLLLSSSIKAESFLLNTKDGKITNLNLTNLRKLTFSNGNMVATYDSGEYTTYALSTIGKLSFEQNLGFSSIEIMENRLAYSAEAALIAVSESQNQKLSIFSTSGQLIEERIIGSSYETIDISHLRSGIYLVRLNGKTIKITKL